jgi:putative flippase GtrA
VIVRKLLDDNRVRYLLTGAVVALFNFAFAWCLFHLDFFTATALKRNIANAIATEASLLFAFVLHAKVTWAERRAGTLLFRITAFHIISGVGLIARTITFAVLDSLGAGWFISTFVSIGVAVPCNFIGYDRWVFRSSFLSSLTQRAAAKDPDAQRQ